MVTEFVNVKGVADHFKVSERLIRNWVSQGKIPKDTYVHIQQTYRFNLLAVEAALLASQGTLEGRHSSGLKQENTEGRVLTEDNIGSWGDPNPEFDTDL